MCQDLNVFNWRILENISKGSVKNNELKISVSMDGWDMNNKCNEFYLIMACLT